MKYALGVLFGLFFSRTPMRASEAVQLLKLAFAKLTAAERNRNKRFVPIPYPQEGCGHELELMRGGIHMDVMRRLFTGQERAGVHRCYEDLDELRQRLVAISRDRKLQHVVCALIVPDHKNEKGNEDDFIKLPPR